jgi:hypothetical protein
MKMPQITIRQTYARIGMEIEPGKLDIRSPRGELHIDQNPAKMEITSPPGRLEIDSTAAWAALGRGGHLAWMNRLYDQIDAIALQNIAKKVEDGNRLAAIAGKQNAIADLASENWRYTNPLRYVGEASFFNVKVRYEPQTPTINITPSRAEIEYIPQKPTVDYIRGRVDIYLRQKNSIEISVIDLYR